MEVIRSKRVTVVLEDLTIEKRSMVERAYSASSTSGMFLLDVRLLFIGLDLVWVGLSF